MSGDRDRMSHHLNDISRAYGRSTVRDVQDGTLQSGSLFLVSRRSSSLYYIAEQVLWSVDATSNPLGINTAEAL